LIEEQSLIDVLTLDGLTVLKLNGQEQGQYLHGKDGSVQVINPKEQHFRDCCVELSRGGYTIVRKR